MARDVGSVLERILAAKREDVLARQRELPLERFHGGLQPSTRGLIDALRASPCGFILECKRSAPSAGQLRSDYDPAAIARQYADVATAISVLTDEPFFGGHREHLRTVSDAVAQPVLCKDFVVDPYQIYEARLHGADAILLMLSVLEPARLRECMQVARELAMDTLVEVHDAQELAVAMELGARLIGINNRDLKTLDVSLRVTESLAPRACGQAVLISESGIQTRDDVRRLRPLVDGFLIGSSLMRRSDLSQAARELAYGRAKVCGLTRAADAQQAWREGACWGGLIFAEQSPRALGIDQAREVRCGVPDLHWAGVFVNAAADHVARVAGELDLHAVQLHGEESPDEVRALRAALPASCELWKAVRVRDGIPELANSGADRMLLDAYHPGVRGGTGERFDWQLVRGYPRRQQLIVAGGLKAANAAQADELGVWALDVSSGVESAPGRKSATELNRFFTVLRGGTTSDGTCV